MSFQKYILTGIMTFYFYRRFCSANPRSMLITTKHGKNRPTTGEMEMTAKKYFDMKYIARTGM